ncbi:site-specific integrase [Salinisphaera sp. P385]|uniref:Site-specific integrase n=1 Tax=Spectribacter acetivorans TaxID=3075603 RepID=A0ABU3B951_9GAMM|nr:site-specific integrase [Salinisphaera sp. P385]MDT0618600.1 site-specific integrase [Salinisphaera sp. P385]
MPSHSLETYLQAAQRDNTQRSYASAVRHFEVAWGGLLPATADTVARYLVAHATALSTNTLRQRLAALAHWHQAHGFSDPTSAAVVKKTLKGIQALHPALEKRAEPLQMKAVARVADWLDAAIAAADQRADTADALRCRRDRAMLLLGFWRGFRVDELVRLRSEHITMVPEEGMTCFLGRSKTDRQLIGTTYRVPALSRWCPVTATLDWISYAGLSTGSLFRGVTRSGTLKAGALHHNSVVPLLRQLFLRAGLASPETYSGHSLRRGFAGWASANGWDARALMEYVGWKDIHSAMRYIDAPDAFGRERIEAALAALPDNETAPAPIKPSPSIISPVVVPLILELSLTPRRQRQSVAKARQTIETICLSAHQGIALDADRSRYRLRVEAADDLVLDEIASSLIEDVYRIADNHGHQLDASLHDEVGDRHWT